MYNILRKKGRNNALGNLHLEMDVPVEARISSKSNISSYSELKPNKPRSVFTVHAGNSPKMDRRNM